ncbi:hypothetical protein [Nonomuraea sp. bgisy101]|uniref:hypothetical protein n=1 Tax=Nonomuraea sp. bgisy101 TaxID=3413784 RepID=UPI003D74E946
MSGWEGFSLGETRRWRHAGFDRVEASAWREAGVLDPGDARLWRTAGAAPRTVVVWQRAGMTPGEAVRWHELGVAPHDAARRHLCGERARRVSWFAKAPDMPEGPIRHLLRAGVPADVARAYADAGWDGAAGEQWAARRVDPGDARLFAALGFTAAEAAALGREAVALVMDWWGAVPVGEVAAWCAAGLTPAEAAAQRARGVTAEQAAVLRALNG